MRHPHAPDCAVPGCARADYKGGLCRKHWYEIPLSDRKRCAIASMEAAYMEAKRWHAVFRAQLGCGA